MRNCLECRECQRLEGINGTSLPSLEDSDGISKSSLLHSMIGNVHSSKVSTFLEISSVNYVFSPQNLYFFRMRWTK